MDFGKVKILLIIVFLGLNLFLIYQWSVLGKSVSIYTEPFSDQVANIKRTFAEHGVTINASLPPSPTMLAMTTVTIPPVWIENAEEISIAAVKKAVSGQPVQVHTPLGSATRVAPDLLRIDFQSANAPLVIKQDGHLDVFHKWLARHVYNFPSYQLFYDALSHQNGVVEYLETVNELPAFSAPLVIDIRQGKVVRIMQTYLAVDKSVHNRSVMSAANALLALASYMDKAHLEIDNTIQAMQLGYSSRILGKSSGYLSPVWRIVSSRGYFYVNAINGEVSIQSQ